MKKVTVLFLMLCLTLSGAFCHASGVARTETFAKGIIVLMNSHIKTM